MYRFTWNLPIAIRRVRKLALTLLIVVPHSAALADPPAAVTQKPIKTITITAPDGAASTDPRVPLPEPVTVGPPIEQPATGLAPPSPSPSIHTSKVRTQPLDEARLPSAQDTAGNPDRHGIRTFRVPAQSMPTAPIAGDENR